MEMDVLLAYYPHSRSWEPLRLTFDLCPVSEVAIGSALSWVHADPKRAALEK